MMAGGCAKCFVFWSSVLAVAAVMLAVNWARVAAK